MSSVSHGPLVLASNNQGKLREIQQLLEPMGWDVRPQGEWDLEEAVEDGLTFVENALIKARHAANHTGMAALGDDSGIVVDALDGRPGLRSARYSDGGGASGNIEKLLGELDGVPEEERTAHFYCVMVMLRGPNDPAPLVSTGTWPGVITTEPRGDGGFGYDPVFYVPEREATAAELPIAIKNVISHRGQALASMIRMLKAEFSG
jgi:XTP/dITP diphosphohydrolase